MKKTSPFMSYLLLSKIFPQSTTFSTTIETLMLGKEKTEKKILLMQFQYRNYTYVIFPCPKYSHKAEQSDHR